MTSEQRIPGSGGGYIKQCHSSEEGMDHDPFMDGARNIRQDSSEPLVAQKRMGALRQADMGSRASSQATFDPIHGRLLLRLARSILWKGTSDQGGGYMYVR